MLDCTNVSRRDCSRLSVEIVAHEQQEVRPCGLRFSANHSQCAVGNQVKLLSSTTYERPTVCRAIGRLAEVLIFSRTSSSWCRGVISFPRQTRPTPSMFKSRNWLAPQSLLVASHGNAHQRSITAGATSGPMAGPGLTDPLAYCQDLVRKHDHESFLTSQCYPRNLRDGYFALKAFSVSRCDATMLLGYRLIACFGRLTSRWSRTRSPVR